MQLRQVIAPSAVIDDSARIGAWCMIGPHVHIGPGVTIGDHVRIQSGAVIGEDGFGYTWGTAGGRWLPKAHEYGVVIEPDVHIGANACIDRGSWRDTIIRTGARIDNLVHVAHNVLIGAHAMVVAQAELSGSVNVGRGAWIGPRACVRERLTIGERALVGMGAVVVKDVDPDTTVAGCPARVIAQTGVDPEKM